MIAFGRRRRTANLPRIHGDHATHAWARTREDNPGYFLAAYFMWTCAICDQRLRMPGNELTLARGAGGCARPGFAGRYEPGDHADYGNMRYIWRQRAVLHTLGRLAESLACNVADLSPVLAGRAEAEKRRQAYLERHPEPTP